MTGDGDKTEAGGNASVAIGGDAAGAQLTTTHVDAPGGKVEITHNYGGSKEPRASPISSPINNLPPVAAAFTGVAGKRRSSLR